MELIIENLDGWVPTTNVYRDDAGQHYIISNVNYYEAQETHIFLASVEVTDIHDMVLKPGITEATSADDYTDSVIGTHTTVVAVDADGDPLNGLSPLHSFPAGSGFDEALAWLAAR